VDIINMMCTMHCYLWY